jgi:hypothetical protein
MDLLSFVMAGRVPATHALAVVPGPQGIHRPGVGGRDTHGHDGKGMVGFVTPPVLMRMERGPAMTIWHHRYVKGQAG